MLIMMRMMNKPQEEPVVPDPVSVEDASPEPVLSEEAVNKIAPELVDSAQKESEPVYVTLGSADPKSPYRLLATLTNRGAAVSRIELNEKAYNDTQDKTGYLGQIVVDEPASMRGVPEPGGVQVQVVGDGTPAYFAGLKKGDLIVAIDLNIGNEPAKVTSFDVLRNELLKTKPGQTIKLGVVRAGNWTPNAVVSETAESQIPNTSSVVDAEQDDGSAPPVDTTTASAPSTVVDWTPEWVEVRLSDTPVSIIRPSSLIKSYNDYENNRGLQGSVYHYNDAGELESDLRSQERKLNGDQLSFLMTLGSYDKEKEVFWVDKPVARRGNLPRPQNLPELTNVELRDSYWDYLPEKSNETTAVFRKVLLSRQMEIIKTYSLVPGEAADAKGRKEENASEYHLTLKLEFRNLDTDNAHKFTYLLDGPTGLPTEGAWYSRGAYGLRDLVVLLNGRSFHVIRANDIAEGKTASSSEQIGLDFLGVDSQYFQCTMIPQHLKTEERLNCFYTPIRVGARAQENPAFSNISFRIKSTEQELAPGGTNGDTFTQEYTIFAGPKKPDILENYHLEKTIVYGWFWFVAIPLLAILHFFKTYLVFNYGLAIILLTILVRLCLFPLSIKQVISSQKMQKIQPELNALKEQYKDRPQEMMQAQQALFRKHNVHPLSGCLPIFIQLPIFIGLYKALSLDVSLYGAPLFSEHFRWCSNLAAPDMLINWSSFWNS
ncbi:MAG: YidC/Oxa1 family insertase periplasmic-domain containing protein, partial [Thermoguttaceae bacterium]|nr:YidC/Oxa1 family insertase periplasmic-domain containing protein [Thermoguttaceae bacterium]